MTSLTRGRRPDDALFDARPAELRDVDGLVRVADGRRRRHPDPGEDALPHVPTCENDAVLRTTPSRDPAITDANNRRVNNAITSTTASRLRANPLRE